LIYQKNIGIKSIQEASQKYFEEKVESIFSSGKYKLAMEERSYLFSLKELLESIVKKSKNLRQEGSRDHRSIPGGSYTSHFYVNRRYDELLRSLELTFFLTKYFEQSDRDGQRVSVYALNYGLCSKFQIQFGRPTESREDRLHFMERKFDYNSILVEYMKSNQEIRCSNCDEEYEIEILEVLKRFHMKCSNCGVGICKVVNLARKYSDIIDSVNANLLLPDSELGILHTLHGEKRKMVASEIAVELDCSGQLVGRRAKNLSERALVKREQAGNVYKYELTEQAKAAYFADTLTDQLNVESSRLD
jgi:predicted transcriptional regulator